MHHGSGHDHGRHHGHAVGDKANHADKGPSTQIATHASVPETAPPNDQSRYLLRNLG
jgi:hypothetical protein